jgi:predicted RNase H-like HicB family nuclease
VKRYTIIVEKALNNYSAYVPDLPECVTTGDAVDAVMVNMREAITVHLDAMRGLGIPIPEPAASSEYPIDAESRLLSYRLKR